MSAHISSSTDTLPLDLAPPIMPAATVERPSGRPLSEISDNNSDPSHRRSIAASLRSGKGEKTSRPNSEVRGDDAQPPSKRVSLSLPQTLTVNLYDYAAVASGKVSSSGMMSPPLSSAVSTASSGSTAPAVPSPGTKPVLRAEPPPALRSVSMSSVKSTASGSRVSRVGEEGRSSDGTKAGESSSPTAEGHPVLLAKRASLRPSPLGASFAEVARAAPTPALPNARQISVDSPQSSSENLAISSMKSKASWLRRASGTSALRSKSKSPVGKDETTLPSSTSLPPSLPPRKGGMSTSPSRIFSDQASSQMRPPVVPRKSSYATVAATAGPSRSRLAEGEGRPAYSPSNSGQGRENIGNIRGRLAAWTNVAQQSSFSRSESTASLASTSDRSALSTAPSRLPATASRVMSNAGSVVQKGWAGLRSRGVGGSISNMSSIGAPPRRESLEPSPSWSSGLSRGGRDRTQSADQSFTPTPSDGPILDKSCVRRPAGSRAGKVFGRDLVQAGRTYGVADAAVEAEGENEWQRRRKQCLPALVVRAVDYLMMWGPKEEGIFRISGRSSHIARLRREFDSGADLDIRECHPGDLDPHAVCGIFKSYLRELPSPPLTTALTPRFEAWARGKQKSSAGNGFQDGEDLNEREDLGHLLKQLPSAHWFLLADIIALLDLIPRHTQTNRMTLNALMLSLGPSLNIPGPIINELLERREIFFVSPPPLSASEATQSLINFGDVTISPPSVPAPLPIVSPLESPLSPETDNAATVTRKGQKPPRLPKKPSITKLFSASNNVSKQGSKETLQSSLNPSVSGAKPPRVGSSPAPSLPSPADDVNINAGEIEHLADTDGPNSVISAHEVRDPPGAVSERTRRSSHSTPIADRFSGMGLPLLPLRTKKSSTGSIFSSASLPTMLGDSIPPLPSDGQASSSASPNPAAVFRRGGPTVFFSSASASERHSRSHSVTSNLSVAQKREVSPDRSAAVSEDLSAQGRKQSSSGAGTGTVREAVRSMEMIT